MADFHDVGVAEIAVDAGYLVRGRSRIDVGHGVREWEISLEDLATGRRATGLGLALRPRPALVEELLPALRAMVSHTAMARSSFVTFRQHLCRFWKFLDEMEDLSTAAGATFRAPTSVFEVPGATWTLFKDWLAGGTNEAHFTYFFCKQAFDAAARLLRPGDNSRLGFPLPPNPFPQPGKLAKPARSRDAEPLSPATARAIAGVLTDRIQRTHERITANRAAMADAEKSRGLALRAVWSLGQKYRWQLNSVPDSHGHQLLRLVGEPGLHVGPQHGSRPLVRSAWWLVPSSDDVLIALCLLLLRTGWNTSTALDMNAEDWWAPHPTRPNQIAELLSAKARANGALQRAYSDMHNPQHPFQLVQRVLEWTQPLRAALTTEAADVAMRLEAGTSHDRADLECRLAQLQSLTRRVWLYMTLRGEIRSLDGWVGYERVNALLAERGVLHQGRPISFSQELTRNTWAVFAYETSGYNLIATQLALGHRDLSSLMHYLDQRGIRNRHRRQFFELQTHVLHEVGRGRLNPRILRHLVENGSISEEEAETLARGGVRSRHGIACANPYAPDPEVDPQHVMGAVCRTQACLDGCSKAYVTLDALEYVARRILELRRFRDEMPLPAWVASDHPHDLEFLEQIAAKFSEANRRAAFKKAAVPQPVIYSIPSRAALAKGR